MKAGSISFIIPYYNVPLDMLRECIESIMALSLQADEREIIVVDDGSDVSLKDALAQLGDNIRYVHKENEGVSSARNLGLEMAAGEYIQFVDADDRLIKSPYLFCIERLKQEKADMIVFDFCTKEQTQTAFSAEGPLSGVQLMQSRNIRGAAWNYLFKKSILGNLLFDSDIAYGEDELFTAQLMLQANRVLVTESKVYYYRQHDASATQQAERHQKRLHDTRTVISRLNTTAASLTDGQSKQALQRRIAQLTMDYLYNHIRMVGSTTALKKEIDGLRKEGLFPLPDKDYTTKYTWFRRLSNHPMGLRLLSIVIPLIPKER